MINNTFNKRAVYLSILLLLTLTSHAQQLPKKPSKSQKDSLKNEIETILADDQKYRWMIMFGELNDAKISEYKAMEQSAQMKRITDARKNIVGISQSQKDSLNDIQAAIDSINFINIFDIIREFGFPHKYVPSYEVTTIILHASPQWMTPDMFQLLLEEVKSDRLEGIEYARVYDRIQLGSKTGELYFVNEHWDSNTKKSTLGIPKDLDATNRARKEIGLKEYVPSN